MRFRALANDTIANDLVPVGNNMQCEPLAFNPRHLEFLAISDGTGDKRTIGHSDCSRKRVFASCKAKHHSQLTSSTGPLYCVRCKVRGLSLSIACHWVNEVGTTKQCSVNRIQVPGKSRLVPACRIAHSVHHRPCIHLKQ